MRGATDDDDKMISELSGYCCVLLHSDASWYNLMRRRYLLQGRTRRMH